MRDGAGPAAKKARPATASPVATRTTRMVLVARPPIAGPSPSSRRPLTRETAPSYTGIEGVLQGVRDEVEGEDGHADRRGRGDDQQRRRGQRADVLGEHPAPGSLRQRNARPDEREGRLNED